MLLYWKCRLNISLFSHFVNLMDNDGVQVGKCFVDFIDTVDKHVAGTTSMILEKLHLEDIEIKDYRGQSFDIAAFMSHYGSERVF